MKTADWKLEIARFVNALPAKAKARLIAALTLANLNDPQMIEGVCAEIEGQLNEQTLEQLASILSRISPDELLNIITNAEAKTVSAKLLKKADPNVPGFGTSTNAVADFAKRNNLELGEGYVSAQVTTVVPVVMDMADDFQDEGAAKARQVAMAAVKAKIEDPTLGTGEVELIFTVEEAIQFAQKLKAAAARATAIDQKIRKDVDLIHEREV